MEKIPDSKLIKFKEDNVKRSKYNMVGRIPIHQIVLGPSGSGKGIYVYTYIYIYSKRNTGYSQKYVYEEFYMFTKY